MSELLARAADLRRTVESGARAEGGGSRPDPADGATEAAAMRDGFGRRIEYLRISVTDKCNLRCVYCMPLEGLPWLRRDEILDFEEIEAIVREMAAMGLRRLRITGGEPLVRKDLPRLVRLLAAVPGIEDIALSTNGVLLAPLAEALRDAGVNRVNLSLDSLRPDRIDAIARRPGCHASIFEGIAAAEAAGLHPIKINVVVMRGRNDDELADFARITMERPWHVRFIELMPTGENLGISASEFVPAMEMLARLRRIGELEPVPGPPGNGPATYFRFPGAAGTVGVITPMSHNYCDRCNRMRLTANGRLRPCLFGAIETNLRDPLRRGEPLRPLIEQTLRIKPERHFLVLGSAAGSGGLLALSQVGG
ncbi:MAG TPA: GTP 3',8-cyclase MoaA [Longimicrobiales bacterium]|nr:GTP 3',8-cyclase MoaA [Longimicrobiales bacterium]